MPTITNIMDYIELSEALQATGTYDTVAQAIEQGAVYVEGGKLYNGLYIIKGGAGTPVIETAKTALETSKDPNIIARATEIATAAVTLAIKQGRAAFMGLATLEVPMVATIAAPLAGYYLGRDLYRENPKLWTKISETLLPFCYEENKIQAFIDYIETGASLTSPVMLLPIAIIDALRGLLGTEIHLETTEIVKSPYGELTLTSLPYSVPNEGSPEDPFIKQSGNGLAICTFESGMYHWWCTEQTNYKSDAGGGSYITTYQGWNQNSQNVFNLPLSGLTIQQIADILNNRTSSEVIPPTAGAEPAIPLEPEEWPDGPVIIPFPGTDPETIPVTPITPFPIPYDPEIWPDPDPDHEPIITPFPTPYEPEKYPDPTPEKPEEWPEEEPWPTVIPFPVEPTEPDDPDWPEVMPWPLPEDPPEEWPTHPEEWPDIQPWPRTPEQWPETEPWPETPPDPESWPEEVPWPDSPQEWPEEVPWPVPWPEDWPETAPWPMPWPETLPYPWPFPYPWPYPMPDPYPDPKTLEEPENQVDPYIDPWPWRDPYPRPDPDPDPTRDPTQPEPPIDITDPIPPPIPDPPPPEGGTDLPPIPILPLPFSSTTGIISVYHPTQQELLTFANWLWVTWQDATIDKIWNNPFDGVITLFELYCTPTDVGRKNIRSGFLDSGVSSETISRYTEINCGSIGVPEYYGNYFDYAPYSKCHIYLPFIGIVELNVDDIVGHGVNVTYRIDEYNGSCIALITCAKSTEVNGVSVDYSTVVYQFSGNCAVELPIAGGSQAAIKAGMLEAAAWGLGSVIGGIIGGGDSVGKNIGQSLAYGAASAVHSVVSAKSSVQHSGSFGSSYGALGAKKPYIIVTRPKQLQVQNYNELYGYQAHKMVRIRDCTGYLRCREVHVISPTASDEEKAQIEQLLKMGVYITE